MLTFVALVAWSAVSVTSAMSQHIMSSRNDSSPWNTVHTSLAVSNADISSVTENAEERMIALPEEFNSVLGEWHLPRFKGLSEGGAEGRGR
ncbi:unnamed protein product [Peronospora effusa]|nr:unnamed protein product [Peronospora effusa]